MAKYFRSILTNRQQKNSLLFFFRILVRFQLVGLRSHFFATVLSFCRTDSSGIHGIVRAVATAATSRGRYDRTTMTIRIFFLVSFSGRWTTGWNGGSFELNMDAVCAHRMLILLLLLLLLLVALFIFFHLFALKILFFWCRSPRSVFLRDTHALLCTCAVASVNDYEMKRSVCSANRCTPSIMMLSRQCEISWDVFTLIKSYDTLFWQAYYTVLCAALGRTKVAIFSMFFECSPAKIKLSTPSKHSFRRGRKRMG